MDMDVLESKELTPRYEVNVILTTLLEMHTGLSSSKNWITLYVVTPNTRPVDVEEVGNNSKI